MRHPLIAIDAIPEDGTTTVEFFGREVLVSKDDGKASAVANVCTHLGGPLEACGQHLVCAWHGATFDRASGECLTGPAVHRLMVLPTRVIDGSLTYVWDES